MLREPHSMVEAVNPAGGAIQKWLAGRQNINATSQQVTSQLLAVRHLPKFRECTKKLAALAGGPSLPASKYPNSGPLRVLLSPIAIWSLKGQGYAFVLQDADCREMAGWQAKHQCNQPASGIATPGSPTLAEVQGMHQETGRVSPWPILTCKQVPK